ncbi:hypothetical protein [Legionella saoudiensis]|uniref:hypothetical protein n=1 Tax=Legionella saoudiensis TaxID=1750561 RepID=UPI00073071D2|nr:hypothetical protein [Legionella saoudiensis]
MDPGFFQSGRDALMLALQKNDLAQLKSALAPKTLYRLALSGSGWIQSDALDALFEQSTAEARALQRFVLASWLKDTESILIPDDDKLKSYLPVLSTWEQALVFELMNKRKGYSYFIPDWRTARPWLFPCLDEFQRAQLFSSLSEEIAHLTEEAIHNIPPEQCQSTWLLNDIIEFLYFKEDEQLLSAVSTALKKAPLLLTMISLKNTHALLNLLSDEDKFLILDELLSLSLLRDADLAGYKAYKKFNLRLLNKALDLFLESMSDEKRALCLDKHAMYFLTNYAENGKNWKPFPNQFIIAALPYLDKASINQLTSNFLNYFKSGVKLSNEHAELGLKLLPYLDRPSLEFIASHYLSHGNLGRKQRHRAWAFLSVRILPQCLDLVDVWIKEYGFKDCLKKFFFDFNFPLPEEKKQAYFQQFYDSIKNEVDAIPLKEAETYARLLGLWSVADNEANQKIVYEGLKKILFIPSNTGEMSLRPEARFICEAFCRATEPITPMPIALVELLKEYGLDLDAPLKLFLVLPSPYELIRTSPETIPLKQWCVVFSKLQAWDKLLYNYLHNNETAAEAIRLLVEWADASTNLSQHQDQNLQHTSALAYRYGLMLLNSYLLSCPIKQLKLMHQLIETGLSIYTYPSEEFMRNYAELEQLSSLAWIATFRQDNNIEPEPTSWCTIL